MFLAYTRKKISRTYAEFFVILWGDMSLLSAKDHDFKPPVCTRSGGSFDLGDAQKKSVGTLLGPALCAGFFRRIGTDFRDLKFGP